MCPICGVVIIFTCLPANRLPCPSHPEQEPRGLHPLSGNQESTLVGASARSPGTWPGAFASLEYRCAAAEAPWSPRRWGVPQPQEPAREAAPGPVLASSPPAASRGSKSSGSKRRKPSRRQHPPAGPTEGAAMLSREPCDPPGHVAALLKGPNPGMIFEVALELLSPIFSTYLSFRAPRLGFADFKTQNPTKLKNLQMVVSPIFISWLKNDNRIC